MKKRIISGLVAAVMLSASVSAGAAEYLDISKMSIGEAADSNGYTYEEYRELMGIDEDIPHWESENAAICKSNAINGILLLSPTVEEFKETTGIDFEITEDMTWGEMVDKCKIGILHDSVDQLKKDYDLSDDVTEDTLYGEIRHHMEQVEMDSLIRMEFSDLPYKHWAHYYVTKMVDDEVIDGYDDGTFLPEKTVTRAEFAKMLCFLMAMEADGTEKGYKDVTDDKWYYQYVNIVGKYMTDTDTFAPDEPATREVVAAAVIKALGVCETEKPDAAKALFSDWETISEENSIYVADAVEKGFIDGFEDDTIRGKNSLTRAQAAAVLYRAFYEYVNMPPAFDIVVAKVDGTEVTLGDTLVAFPITEMSEDMTLQEAISESVENTVYYLAMRKACQSKGIKYEEAKRAAVSERSSMAANVGYKDFCIIAKEYGTSIEFIDEFMLGADFLEMYENEFGSSDDIDISECDIEIYEEAWAEVTEEDISLG